MVTIFTLPDSENAAIEFLQQKGVLPKKRVCKAGHAMKLSVGKEVYWHCEKGRAGCSKVRMRVGNFLEGSRLPFTIFLRFVYCWSYKLTSGEFCRRELDIDEDTTVDYSMYMRNVCQAYLLSKPVVKIGGEGQTVEVDESLFSKRKNNQGRILPPTWVFGGICRESRECFMVEVPDRTAKTLLEIIKERIAVGTTVISDCWRAYKTAELEAAGYEHLRVNHSLNFIDPSTGAHTQTVERLWGSAKERNKRQRGKKRELLDSYMQEFMLRQEVWRGGDLFEFMLNAIADNWPPEEQLK